MGFDLIDMAPWALRADVIVCEHIIRARSGEWILLYQFIAQSRSNCRLEGNRSTSYMLPRAKGKGFAIPRPPRARHSLVAPRIPHLKPPSTSATRLGNSIHCTSQSHMPKKPSRNSTEASSVASPSVKKYCQVCGRIISPNHRNFEERKYCGKYCSGTRLTQVDRDLEGLFRKMARERGSVSCGEVQASYEGRDGREESEHEPGGNEDGEKRQREGMEVARWRERVRRAGRRVAVLEMDGEGAFQCVQEGKVVEGSFAKGEWSVRFCAS